MDPTKKKLKSQGRFLAIPHAVAHSPAFRGLSAIAVKLLIDVAIQFDGRNNGDFSAAWKVMKTRGWKSEGTLHRAKQELLKAGFIAETRKGRRPNLCSLYGITWKPLNPSPKFDIKPAAFPFGEWERGHPLVVRARSKNEVVTPTVVVNEAT